MNELPRSLKMATLWLLLGIAVFLGVQWWQAQQQRSLLRAEDGVIELRRSGDGHFHWPGTVNGVAVDFMVDTGATSTALPLALAERAGLRREGRVSSSTAGGMVIGEVARADIALEGGVQLQRLRVAVLPQLSHPLLGMDVLGKLHFSQRDGVLRLEPAR